ncbi:hypothetical protein [Rubritalea sp.]|uniref:hypothetical protein n=1 Tax=Rubritalea sp. TaxID=2109375 RepID=UPI003EF411C3
MKTLKKITPVLAAAAAMFAFTPQQVEARDHGHNQHSQTYASGRTNCGCAIYTKRVVKGYDCHGRPVYAHYSQPVKHSCKSSHYRPAPRSYSSCRTHTPSYRTTYNHSSRKSTYSNSRSGISVSYRSGW